ncbi:LLM class flavin-dependent oxidoreductase [Rhizobium sp. CF142]|uniref:LLM class flavin-dependent oxidoreductase n=1 Tax=Rhizobium sp. CF142 TaxID=1144314 RepID=UPI00026EEC1E|nr:LLM class flavin-dependent oxidoreductase [Rhizobium sp. CF142]EJJ26697.1 FMN-dependent oxidoreductase, nitrilotriacetate monooxygenase family [Rhizobium sp. CF142]
MSERSKKLKLGVYLDNHGGHVASWKHTSVQPADAMKQSYWISLAQTAERGLMDFLFLADANRVLYIRNPKAMSQVAATPFFEPITLLSSLAGFTQNIGLVATMSTTYSQPYQVARLFSSLDHLTEGRASWNVVTSSSSEEAPNFQRDAHMEHDDRYARAREFLDIVCGLWDSWEDDAFLFNKQTGTYLDADKMHYLNYQSDRFSVRGPLNQPRAPQGWPVIFQAGSSEIGREFGAEKADALFTAQDNIHKARAFCLDVKTRAARHGRIEDDIAIFVGTGTVIGQTMAEAEDKFAALQANVSPDVALHLLSEVLAVDLSGMDPDKLVTDLPASDGMKSRRELLLTKAIDGKMTLLDLSRFVAAGRGHRSLIGTPQTIADNMQEWYETKAADGFLLAPFYLPDSLTEFVDLVVPELQRRGIYRTAYEGKTLRENLGLKRPAHPAAGG